MPSRRPGRAKLGVPPRPVISLLFTGAQLSIRLTLRSRRRRRLEGRRPGFPGPHGSRRSLRSLLTMRRKSGARCSQHGEREARYATPARRRSWKCTTPTGLPPSTTISVLFARGHAARAAQNRSRRESPSVNFLLFTETAPLECARCPAFVSRPSERQRAKSRQLL